ncbi:MAG: hypothetical protein AB7F29_09910 [Candidatus Nitrosocosmicus sp.]
MITDLIQLYSDKKLLTWIRDKSNGVLKDSLDITWSVIRDCKISNGIEVIQKLIARIDIIKG